MAVEVVPASSSPAKSPAKKIASKSGAAKAAKVAAIHPPYQTMVKDAVKALKERNGSSRAAILKYIVANYKVGQDVKMISAHLRAALKRGAASGALKQTKGTGANGRFRLGESAKKAAPAVKKVAPKKKVAAKKTTPAAAKKALPKKTASPKKAAAPKKANTPKKPKSPKKVKAAPKQTIKPKKASPKKAVKMVATPKKA